MADPRSLSHRLTILALMAGAATVAHGDLSHRDVGPWAYDGRLILGVDDTVVVRWEALTGRVLERIPIDAPGAHFLNVTADGKYVDAEGFGGGGPTAGPSGVRLYRLGGGVAKMILERRGSSLRAYDIQLERAFLADWQGKAEIVNLSSGRTIARFDLPPTLLDDVRFGEDGRTLATSGYTNIVIDANSGQVLGQRGLVSEGLGTLPLDGTGRLARGSGDPSGTGIVWDAQAGKTARVAPDERGRVQDSAAVRGGRRFVTGGVDGHLRVWDARGGREIRSAILPGAIVRLDVAHGGERCLVRWQEGENGPTRVSLVALDTGEEKVRLDGEETQGLVGFSPDSRTFLSVRSVRETRLLGMTREAIVRDARTGTVLRRFRLRSGIDKWNAQNTTLYDHEMARRRLERQ